MPAYTLVITSEDGRQSTTVSEFTDDRAAIAETGIFTSPEHPSVAVARGTGSDLEFLGAWDWVDGQARWTPED